MQSLYPHPDHYERRPASHSDETLSAARLPETLRSRALPDCNAGLGQLPYLCRSTAAPLLKVGPTADTNHDPRSVLLEIYLCPFPGDRQRLRALRDDGCRITVVNDPDSVVVHLNAKRMKLILSNLRRVTRDGLNGRLSVMRKGTAHIPSDISRMERRPDFGLIPFQG
jgi:hypothetical protein